MFNDDLAKDYLKRGKSRLRERRPYPVGVLQGRRRGDCPVTSAHAPRDGEKGLERVRTVPLLLKVATVMRARERIASELQPK